MLLLERGRKWIQNHLSTLKRAENLGVQSLLSGMANHGRSLMDWVFALLLDGLPIAGVSIDPPICWILPKATLKLLEDTVVATVGDVRREAFRLATGNMKESPFDDEVLKSLRGRWAKLLDAPNQALVIDEGQPFLLRGLSQWLRKFEDPDFQILVDGEDSFASGVWVGVDKPLPRCPQVFPEKLKHRKLDETEFNPIAFNYPSAQLSVKELEAKFREEEQLGRMFPSTLPVVTAKYGAEKVRVASMAAISKPDGGVRPLHDATHSVMVNHEIRYADQIQCPGPPEVAAMVREATETSPSCENSGSRLGIHCVQM